MKKRFTVERTIVILRLVESGIRLQRLASPSPGTYTSILLG